MAIATAAQGDEILFPVRGPGQDQLAVHWPDFVRITNPLIGRFTTAREAQSREPTRRALAARA